jgi:hypothetical protein
VRKKMSPSMRRAFALVLAVPALACGRPTSSPDEMRDTPREAACRAALGAAILAEKPDAWREGLEPHYLLDAGGPHGCALAVERAAPALTDLGYDAFPWDEAFGYRWCAHDGRFCTRLPVGGAVHVTVDDRTFPGSETGGATGPFVHLPVPASMGTCALREAGGFAFTVLFADSSGPGNHGYTMALNCDAGRWNVSASPLVVVY